MRCDGTCAAYACYHPSVLGIRNSSDDRVIYTRRQRDKSKAGLSKKTEWNESALDT